MSEDILWNYDDEKKFDADIFVFRLGENITGDDKCYFKEEMQKFIGHICPNGKMIFTTCFWDNSIIDDAIREVANERGAVCIDTCFSKEEKNMVLRQFSHSGVAHHPSDEGMEAIAKEIFEHLKK